MSQRRAAAAAKAAIKAEEYDSYDELLTDGEDEEQEPVTQADGTQPPSLIVGYLRTYRTAQYSASDLNTMCQTGDIDLQVDYQRDVVWTEARQEGLIDSLFLNYFIPPVLFSTRTSDDGTQKRVCMDGKQRLTSICKFMMGQRRDHFRAGYGKGKKFWYTYDPKIHRGRELPLREKKLFAQKQIHCAEFEDLNEGQEREIFQRVQLGVALSAAEKLQALATPYSVWMTSLLNKHVFGEEGDTINSYFKDWKQDRGQAYQNVCVLVYFIEKYPLPITSVSSIALGSWLKRVDAPEVHLRRKVDTVFYYYIELMKMYQDVAITACGKKLSPIEFSFIGVVLYVLGAYMSLEEIARRIGHMRTYVRQIDSNVRSNGSTIAALWQWLGQQPQRTIPGMRPMFEEEQEAAPSARKRRREEEADGDYVGGGIRADSPGQRRNTRFQG
ncbi:hypothetical protein FFLO_00457 [Filobasidium floriforme]|uniref:GmrSD restriction endonucleases N-terminal domain-containing protein n=1 Tax=Filobasidium floriforme TaxID=5210 RepID=A0A8K0JSD3_9TREE|nr:hypothetical protein FFLO_00457 [Filobasidium floriforme]